MHGRYKDRKNRRAPSRAEAGQSGRRVSITSLPRFFSAHIRTNLQHPGREDHSQMATLEPIVSTHRFHDHQKEVLNTLLAKKLAPIEKMCKRFKEGRVSLEVDATSHESKERLEVSWRLAVPRDSLYVHVEASELGKLLAECQDKMINELHRYRDRMRINRPVRVRAADVAAPGLPAAEEAV